MNPYPNLKVLRLQNNYKQEYVADTLGMSQPEYSKLETGHRKLDANCIRNLCNLYDVTSDLLLNQNSSSASDKNNARSSFSPDAPAKMPPFPKEIMANELLLRLMENYTLIIDSYLLQQNMQQKMLDKLIEKSDDKFKAS